MWGLVGKHFGGGMAAIEYAQVYSPLVDIYLMIGAVNELEAEALEDIDNRPELTDEEVRQEMAREIMQKARAKYG